MTLKNTVQGSFLEFMGVFFLVYAAGMLNVYSVAIVSSFAFTSWPTAVSQGIILGLFIYSGIGISKITLNPIATLLLILTGSTKVIDGLFSIFFQLLGSVAGAALLKWYFHLTDRFGKNISYNTTYPHFRDNSDDKWETIRFEAAGTMLLMVFILFSTFTFRKTPTAKAILIGSAQFFGVVTNGQITGASMNPARVFGPNVIDGFFENGYWSYYIGPLLGAIASLPLCWFLLLGKGWKEMFFIAMKDEDVRERDEEDENEFNIGSK